MRQTTLLSLLLFCSYCLQAQFSPDPVATPEENQGSFVELQTQYYQWKSTHDISKEKGWKWYARWAHETESRLNGDGSMPSSNILFEQAMQFQRQKEGNVSRQANWSPAGPTDIPIVTNSFDNFGMGRINTMAFHPTDSNTFWVGVAQGGVWKTTNHGQSWMPLTDDLPIMRISDIAVDPKHPDTMYISVGDYAYLAVALDLNDRNRHTHYGLGVYKTVDGGQNWTPTGLTFQQTQKDGSLTRRVFIDENNSDELLAAGIFGVRKSYDGGTSWVSKSDSIIWDIERDPNNPNVLYASSAYIHSLQSGNAAILKSTDFGETWTELPTNIPPRGVQRLEIAISPSDPNYVYVIAGDVNTNFNSGFYGLYRTTNAGQSWTVQNSFATDSLNILHWSDGDRVIGGQGTYDLVILVDPNDKERVYAGGVNLWGSANGGVTWNGASYWRNSFGPSVHADHHFLTYNPLDKQFYLCHDGGLNRTKQIEIGSWLDAQIDPVYEWPTQWEDISNGLEVRSFYRIGINEPNPDRLIAGAQDNGTAFINQNGLWVSAVGGDGMDCSIHPVDPNIMYASYQYGNFFRTRDSWNSRDYISYDMLFVGGDEGEWVTPLLQNPQDPLHLIAGYGQVWSSSDAGLNWNPISNFPPMQGVSYAAPASALAIAPTDTNTIYVAKRIYHSFNQPSEMFRTTDNGQNWTNITAGLPDSMYLTYITVDEDDSKKLWVTVKGFVDGAKVFYSDNGGDSWQNISKNLPNVSANCIVQDPTSPHNTVYVGMDVGVWYHSDTSSQWALYSDELPNVIVSELEINPTAGKIYAATFGRGVWVSDLAEIAISIEKEQLDDLELKLFPNPNKGQFRIEMQQMEMESLSWEVVDITGRVLKRSVIKPVSGRFEADIDLDLSYGLYFLKLTHGKASRVKRFIVK